MYRYKYVQVKLTRGLAKMMLENHREIINSTATDGWRYVGFIPVREIGGVLETVDLVFEKADRDL